MDILDHQATQSPEITVRTFIYISLHSKPDINSLLYDLEPIILSLHSKPDINSLLYDLEPIILSLHSKPDINSLLYDLEPIILLGKEFTCTRVHENMRNS